MKGKNLKDIFQQWWIIIHLKNYEVYLPTGISLVGALLDAVADGVAVLVDLAHAPGAAVHLQARI